MPKALKSLPKSHKSPNLVTLLEPHHRTLTPTSFNERSLTAFEWIFHNPIRKWSSFFLAINWLLSLLECLSLQKSKFCIKLIFQTHPLSCCCEWLMLYDLYFSPTCVHFGEIFSLNSQSACLWLTVGNLQLKPFTVLEFNIE